MTDPVQVVGNAVRLAVEERPQVRLKGRPQAVVLHLHLQLRDGAVAHRLRAQQRNRPVQPRAILRVADVPLLLHQPHRPFARPEGSRGSCTRAVGCKAHSRPPVSSCLDAQQLPRIRIRIRLRCIVLVEHEAVGVVEKPRAAFAQRQRRFGVSFHRERRRILILVRIGCGTLAGAVQERAQRRFDAPPAARVLDLALVL
ncbi:MAG TPA: hypothetical protein VHG30_06130, partial [Microvirga sp.]|nr:hypothetical protein [Microvirga sp.]